MTTQRYTIVHPDGSRGHAWNTTRENAERYANFRGNDVHVGDRLCGPRGETVGTFDAEGTRLVLR